LGLRGERQLEDRRPEDGSGRVDAETEQRVAPVFAVMRRRLAAVVDMGNRVQRPRGVAVLEVARDRGGRGRRDCP
jgi:hypothetical protein